MSQAGHELHSPLSLLGQWRDRADGAPLREFLVTGYTLDLVFLERHCISTARALGARVTVLGDAHQSVHDPVDVRHAGRAYQHGHASCGGAFHPKLVLLLGDEEVWAAIGSGNPTMSGWGHNHELWLVIRAPRGPGPAALRELGDWLIDMPRVVSMPSWIAETVEHIGRSVSPAGINGSLPRVRVLGNLRRSLVEQLPTAARSLRMTAPFLDARSAAVRALIARLSPDQVDLALQPTLSQYDGPSLHQATASVRRAEFRWLDEDRTYHGKLIEWTADSEITALVGSANLSTAAMLATTETGGNCELVVSCPVPASLLPDGETDERSAISTRNTIPVQRTDIRSAGLILLGARRLPDLITVELTTTAREPVTIETSPNGAPGTWIPAHVLSADSDIPVTAMFRVPEQLGGAVRAWVEIGRQRIVSEVVFLTDTARCQPRDERPDQPKLIRDYDLDEVITDPVLSTRFSADLLRLLGQLQQRNTAAIPLRASVPIAEGAAGDDRWSTWLDRVERTLGPSLTGLVFPGAAVAQLPDAGAGWSVGPNTDDTQLADGETDDLLDEMPTDATGMVTARAPEIPPSQRQKWRAAARKLRTAIRAEPRPPLELRMAVARLYLNLLAAGIWETEQTWRAELRDVLATLPPTDEEYHTTPGQALSFMSSLTAVCLALLFHDANPHGGTEHDLIAKAAWNSAREWAPFAEPHLVEAYLYLPEQSHARVANQTEVETVIELATAAADDPHAEVRAALEHEELPVQLIDGVWVADGQFRNPRRIAARIANLAGPQCVVLARNTTKTSIVLRHNATLAIAESTSPRWQIYQLTSISTPLSILGNDIGLPSGGTTHPLVPIPDRIQELASAAQVSLVHLMAALQTR